MTGLFQVDITAAQRMLAAADAPLSFTTYIVACVGRAAADRPEMHAYRDWRGRLVEHHHVDVQVLIEVATGQGQFRLVHVVRDADIRGVAEISGDPRRQDPAVEREERLTTRHRCAVTGTHTRSLPGHVRRDESIPSGA